MQFPPRHRTHISQMRMDRYKRLVEGGTFTMFVQGAGSSTIPLVVNKNTTTTEIMEILAQRRLIPSNFHEDYLLASCKSQKYRIPGWETMGQLGIGSLGHLHLRVKLLGGSSNPSTPNRRKRAPHFDEDDDFESSPPAASGSSPSKNTRSQTGSKSSKPVVLESPKKRRKTEGEKALPDVDVWHLPDQEIIGVHLGLPSRVIVANILADQAKSTWRSNVYDHYNVSLIRHHTMNNEPGYLEFKFTCAARLDTAHKISGEPKTTVKNDAA
ncbi:hypothetical protein HWV62_20320 [Athelia sp. TMB]|nr:hypothetical protein HWV62_20320 [Athelia sp. TMB]